MGELEEALSAICKEEAMASLDDKDAALRKAKTRVKRSRRYSEWLDILVTRAISVMIDDARHYNVVQQKTQARSWSTKQKVDRGDGVEELCEELYLTRLTINNMVLGTIPTAELGAFASTEQAKADGYWVNAELCRRLQVLCEKKRGETVADCVSNRQVGKLLKQIQGELSNESDAA